MASPRTGGQFYVETNRQAAKAIGAAEDSRRRFMDEIADLSQVYFDVYCSAQLAALGTAFQLQNSMVQASRILLDAAVQTNRGLFEEWTRVVAGHQTAATRTMAAGISMFGDSVPKGRS